MTPLTAPLANAAARANGHLPGPTRSNGVMQWAECQRCKAAMVNRLDGNEGFGGAMIEKPCGGKAA